MKIYDEKIQKHLLHGGKIKRELETYEVVLHIDENLFFLDDDGDIFNISITDLMCNDWEIVEPEYDWDRIIKDKVLCVFSDTEDFKSFNISLLTDIDKISYDEDIYITNEGIMYDYCKPFNPADFNIAKDLKEYEK